MTPIRDYLDSLSFPPTPPLSLPAIEGTYVPNYSSIGYRGVDNLTSGSSREILPTQANSIIEGVRDLIDNLEFKPFFFKRLYSLGPTKFLALADRARQGRYPSRLFCSLLKERSK